MTKMAVWSGWADLALKPSTLIKRPQNKTAVIPTYILESSQAWTSDRP